MTRLLPRFRVLALALVAGPRRARHSAQAQDYPDPADHAGRALCRRRRQRRDGAHRRREDEQDARPADRDREPARRRRRARDPAGRQGGARRLHAGDRRHRLARGQSDAAAECRLRRAQGFRAGRADRHQRDDRAGASVGAREVDPGADRASSRKIDGKFNYASAGIGSGIHLARRAVRQHGRRRR